MLAKVEEVGAASEVLRFRRIGHIAVLAATRQQALRALAEAAAERRHVKVAFANAHVVNVAAAEPAFREALQRSLVLPDGLGVDLASRMLYGELFPDNLNGTDFVPEFLASVATPLTVALVGARPGVAERAAQALAALAPAHLWIPLSDGYFDERGEAAILAMLESLRPDVLLVAFGNPRQERWIAERIDARHCSLAIGVGALFDFLSGESQRAPTWMRALRLEWVHRLAREPRRLWRRYMVGNPVFLARIARQRLRGAP